VRPGSSGFADLEHRIGYAYVMNYYDVAEASADPRSVALIDEIYAAVGSRESLSRLQFQTGLNAKALRFLRQSTTSRARRGAVLAEMRKHTRPVSQMS
jgi:hypothetical protein